MRTRRLHPFIGAVVALLIGVGVHLVAQQRNAVPAFTDGDWPRYAGDFAGTKHSKLVQAWTFQGVGAQQTPIAVNGIVYASTPGGVVALDGTSGDVLWRYGAAATPGAGRGAGSGRGGAGRGRGTAEGAPGDAAQAV